MNLSDPSISWSSALEGTVLSVLAEHQELLSVSEVAALADRGTEIGIRRTLSRLVLQGIVIEQRVGRSHGYLLNREHVAAEGVLLLGNLRKRLWDRLREHIETWSVKPLQVTVFGSAARRDGDESSDIDLLFIRRQTADEILEESDLSAPAKAAMGLLTSVLAKSAQGVQVPGVDARIFEDQVTGLHDLVHAWSGNRLHAIVKSQAQWAQEKAAGTPIASEITDEGVVIYRDRSTPSFGATT